MEQVRVVFLREGFHKLHPELHLVLHLSSAGFCCWSLLLRSLSSVVIPKVHRADPIRWLVHLDPRSVRAICLLDGAFSRSVLQSCPREIPDTPRYTIKPCPH